MPGVLALLHDGGKAAVVCLKLAGRVERASALRSTAGRPRCALLPPA